MANESKPAETKTADVQRVAQHLFAERSARSLGRNSKQVAVGCFRDAEAFLEVAGRYASGQLAAELKAPAGPQPSVASAPNIGRASKAQPVNVNHPHNMVSVRYGDLKKVARVLKHLKENPAPADPNAEDVCVISQGDLQINWGTEETKLARVLFPEFVVEPSKEPALS